MSNEREMLEFAAKVCGIMPRGMATGSSAPAWNPKDNSADCAAMCVKLGINSEWDIQAELIICDTSNSSGYIRTEMFINHNNDREAAWRYAATMVAAKIGGMK